MKLALWPKASTPFVRTARRSGVRAHLARLLEPAARAIAPEHPEDVLERRQHFEEAALRAVIGDAGNLELSFRLVDDLASACEQLGLVRTGDVPDPFRRVWIENVSGDRLRGVVLTHRGQEIAVFCPPRTAAFAERGDAIAVSYRGTKNSIEFELRLDDAVRLPGAYVLHLRRATGDGAIGRQDQRYDVSLHARVSPVPANDEAPAECRIHDISRGGVRVTSSTAFTSGDPTYLELELNDGIAEAFSTPTTVTWTTTTESGEAHFGLQFEDLPLTLSRRLDRLFEELESSASDDEAA